MACKGKTRKQLPDSRRGLSPYPAAWTAMQDASGKVYSLKIFASEKEAGTPKEPTGTILSDGRTYLKVAVDGGYLHLTELQIAGKKRMRTEDFLHGFRMPDGLMR